MKYLVKSHNGATLQDLFGRQTIHGYRPCVVINTPFIENLRGKKLEVIEVLADEAEDSALAFATDLEKAIAELPRLKSEPAAEPKPTPRKPAAKK